MDRASSKDTTIFNEVINLKKQYTRALVAYIVAYVVWMHSGLRGGLESIKKERVTHAYMIII